MTPAAVPLDRPGEPWSPHWRPAEDSVSAEVTLVCTPCDDPQYMALAFAAHQPRYGRITVHPTPVAGNGFYLAHDLMRAYGKHLPVPAERRYPPTWTTNTAEGWRFAAAWTLALGVTHLTVCRAHTLRAAQWQNLLALSNRTGVQLTLLCNGALPVETVRLLTTVAHRRVQDLPTAQIHWRNPPGPEPASGAYPWWTATAALTPRDDEVWFHLPPTPAIPSANPSVIRKPPPDATTAQLPGAQGRQDHLHPHIARVAARIYTRIAHPAHAAVAGLSVLTGYTSDQIAHLHTDTSDYDPAVAPPLWTAPLNDAARHLADLRGHHEDWDLKANRYMAEAQGRRVTPNPLATPSWEHGEIERSLFACRLLLTPPARKSRTRAPKTTGDLGRATSRTSPASQGIR
jgi:hypothetical protein